MEMTELSSFLFLRLEKEVRQEASRHSDFEFVQIKEENQEGEKKGSSTRKTLSIWIVCCIEKLYQSLLVIHEFPYAHCFFHKAKRIFKTIFNNTY